MLGQKWQDKSGSYGLSRASWSPLRGKAFAASDDFMRIGKKGLCLYCLDVTPVLLLRVALEDMLKPN
jgi:hypothetical protein